MVVSLENLYTILRFQVYVIYFCYPNSVISLPALGVFMSLAELSPRFKSRQYEDTLSTSLLHSSAVREITKLKSFPNLKLPYFMLILEEPFHKKRQTGST